MHEIRVYFLNNLIETTSNSGSEPTPDENNRYFVM